jgi:hypothetical protein
MKLCSIALFFFVAISGEISTAEGAPLAPTRSTVGKKKGKTAIAIKSPTVPPTQDTVPSPQQPPSGVLEAARNP